MGDQDSAWNGTTDGVGPQTTHLLAAQNVAEVKHQLSFARANATFSPVLFKRLKSLWERLYTLTFPQS